MQEKMGLIIYKIAQLNCFDANTMIVLCINQVVLNVFFKNQIMYNV